MKLFEKTRINNEREIRILGIPIMQYGRTVRNGLKEKYIDVFPKSFEKQILEKILSIISNEHDHIWIVRTTGLGEAHLLNFMIDELCEMYKVKNPCFVSHRAIYKDMFALYSDIPFYHLNLKHQDYAPFLQQREYFYKGRHFHVHHCTIAESIKWLNEHKAGDKSHTIEAIKKWSGIKNYIKKKISFGDDLRRIVEEKISSLNRDRFVYFSPEANGSKGLPGFFWSNLCNEFEKRGYDVFVNTASGETPYGKSVSLTIAESACLAHLSKGIIALRCGFSEILSAIENVPLYIIYSSFYTIQSSWFIDSYTLKEYPFISSAFLKEYGTNGLDYKELTVKILKDFEA